MAKKTTVRIVLPTRGREYTYTYPYDLSQNREEQAMRTFYEQECPNLFALAGRYCPLDVHVSVDYEEVSMSRLCYCEGLWSIFFEQDERHDPWHKRYSHFSISLYEYRYREEQREQQKHDQWYKSA